MKTPPLKKNSVCLMLLFFLMGACGGGAEKHSCYTSKDCADSDVVPRGQLCVESRCVACSADEECREDSFYGPSSFCDDGICASSSGGEGSETESGDTTRDTQTHEDTDTKEVCPKGQKGCPCQEGDSCEEGLYCDGDGLCAVCDNSVAGCPCNEGACTAGLVCDEQDEACREPLSCADLECKEHQLCEPGGAGADAACLEDCEAGYVWIEATTSCVAENCEEGAPGSISEECRALLRSCEEDDLGAHCGACELGYVDEGGVLERCREAIACEDIQAECDFLYRECAPGDSEADARCGPCIEGYEEQSGRCVDVAVAVDCDPEDPMVEVCDELNKECKAADGVFFCGGCFENHVKEDPTEPESRCVALSPCGGVFCADDEYCIEGTCQKSECADDEAFAPALGRCVRCQIQSCDMPGATGRLWPRTTFGGLSGDTCLCETVPGYFWDVGGGKKATVCDGDGDGWVRLTAQDAVNSADPEIFENARCDLHVIDRVVLINDFGQELELLSCASGFTSDDDCRTSDVKPLQLLESVRNDDENLLSDSQEADLHPRQINALTKACRSLNGDYNDDKNADVTEVHDSGLEQFSHFVELHRSWYEPPGAQGGLGRYVIAEKKRSEPGFPLTYSPAQGDYWPTCHRHRDAAFEEKKPGFDFAKWSCDLPAGTCGLVDQGGQMWWGMTHHSQFKCLDLEKDTLEGFDLNRCTYSGIPTSRHGTQNPGEVSVSCAPVAPSDVTGDVAFGSASYVAYNAASTYERGCVDECQEFFDQCPGHDPERPGASCATQEYNFGKKSCGCNQYYGGPSCGLSCPSSDLLYSQALQYAPRQGTWLCGHIASTSSPDIASEDGAVELRGEVPPFWFELPSAPEEGDTDTGPYRLLPFGGSYETVRN